MNQAEAELFLASCGARASLRVMVAAPSLARPSEHLFDRPFIVAGRDPRNCVHLEGPDVSRRHAYFQMVEGRLLGVDLGSRTGLVWPGGAGGFSGWVTPSSGVRIGAYSLFPAGDQFTNEPPSANGHDWDPLQDRMTRPDWPQATIELSGGDQPRTIRWRLNRMVALVGAAAACRIRLKHSSVSGFHCSLVWTPLGVWLVDLRSRESTQLNGRTTASACIADGDEIGVGAYRLRFRYGAADGVEQTALVAPETKGPTPAALAASPPALPAMRPTQEGPRDDFLQAAPGQGDVLPVWSGAGQEGRLLAPVMQQFNLMQQQLCDQFHQTTLMMLRMFTTMHQEQAALVREEMQQIQRVTAELQAMQRQLQDGVPPGRPTPPGAPSPGAPVPVAPAPHALAGEKLPAANANGSTQPIPSPDSPTADPLRLPAANPADVDAWLNQRIEELRAERQTRWQRVLSFLGGQ